MKRSAKARRQRERWLTIIALAGVLAPWVATMFWFAPPIAWVTSPNSDVVIGAILATAFSLSVAGFGAVVKLYRLRRAEASPSAPSESAREEMRDLLSASSVDAVTPVAAPAGKPKRRFYYVESLKLRNIRCFERLELRFNGDGVAAMTSLILGDNSTGKSTILRGLAIGLCPESDAVSLMTSMNGSLLRQGESEGRIEVKLRSSDGEWSGKIETRVRGTGASTVLRQETTPKTFPWDDLFLCGYGTQRTVQGSKSHERYFGRLAVASLFGDTEALQDPEVVLLKREPGLRAEIEAVLQQILMLEGDAPAFEQSPDRGIEMAGPWGKQRVANTSDGYRSTAQWLLDFIAWQIYAYDTRQVGEIGGVLLLDEIEQHLHPRWQRHVLQRLRAQLPHVQIIATTHTPLIASGATDLDRVSIHRLRLEEKGTIEPQIIEPRYLRGKRADQVLASAFGLLTSKSPKSVARLERYVHLLGRHEGPERNHALAELRQEMSADSAVGENAFDRVVEAALADTLDKMVEEGNELLDIEAKRRLHDLLEEVDEDDERVEAE